MTTSDELLALARKAKIPQQPDEGMSDALARRHFARLDFQAAANPAAIIALIERHSAEVERLTRERDEARLALVDEKSAAMSGRFKTRVERDEANKRAESAEAALAAAQKRVGVLEEALKHAIPIIEKHVPRDALGTDSQGGGDGWNDHSWPILDEYLHHMRAALGNDDGKVSTPENPKQREEDRT